MDMPPRYEEDIYAWSQHQAQLLRALAGRAQGLPNALDLRHVAEEIEDLGISELNRVLAHLEGMLFHLAKAASLPPEALPLRKWLAEVDEHQSHALRHCTAAMRHRIELDRVWTRAVRRAEAELRRYGDALAPLPTACPFALDSLLSELPNAEALLARLRPAG